MSSCLDRDLAMRKYLSALNSVTAGTHPFGLDFLARASFGPNELG